MYNISCFACDTNIYDPEGTYYIRKNYLDNFLISFFKTPFVYKKDGELIKCEKNHYIINTPYAPCEHGGTGCAISNDMIFFSGDGVQELLNQLGLPLNTAFKVDGHSIIAPYIERIMSERLFKQSGYEYKISAIITDMIVSLGRQFQLVQNNSHPAFSAINEARTYMLSNLDRKISLDELAKMTNYSKSHFCSLYSQFFSSSPIDDLLSARIEKAVSSLEHSHLSVNEISEICGFSSVNYFSRKFKEKTGNSPSSYRN